MVLTERQEQKLEILPNGVIQVQDIRIILDDDIEISRMYHRKVIDVDNDVTGESQRIRAITPHVWTPEVRAARQSERARREV